MHCSSTHRSGIRLEWVEYMPEIQIRPVKENEINVITAFEHDYSSDYVWQMDIQQEEEKEIRIYFRQIRLPRTVKVNYPRHFKNLKKDWKSKPGILVACLNDQVIGYICLVYGNVPGTVWATDLVVKQSMRRQGVASALILASQAWTRQHEAFCLILEMQSKNHPAISLARKMGYDFCGYNDRYFLNGDIALFYSKTVR